MECIRGGGLRRAWIDTAVIMGCLGAGGAAHCAGEGMEYCIFGSTWLSSCMGNTPLKPIPVKCLNDLQNYY